MLLAVGQRRGRSSAVRPTNRPADERGRSDPHHRDRLHRLRGRAARRGDAVSRPAARVAAAARQSGRRPRVRGCLRGLALHAGFAGLLRRVGRRARWSLPHARAGLLDRRARRVQRRADGCRDLDRPRTVACHPGRWPHDDRAERLVARHVAGRAGRPARTWCCSARTTPSSRSCPGPAEPRSDPDAVAAALRGGVLPLASRRCDRHALRWPR